jgi:hypothetical protein
VNAVIHPNKKSKRWQLAQWAKRRYLEPSPHFVKMICLEQFGIPNSVWVETGTYLGETSLALARFSPRVITIEPSQFLFDGAVRRLGHLDNVELINGLSEEVFPYLLPSLNGDVSFWLDGHFSEGNTFRGPKETPIAEELREISKVRKQLGRVSVLIDDVRLFGRGDEINQGYPPLNFLVDWARDEGLDWEIVHDIFVARTPRL